MAHTVDPSVLRRKIAAHHRPAPAGPDASGAAARGFGRALRHAAMPFEGLDLVLGEVEVGAGKGLDAAIAALPEHGLSAALEDGAGRRGLIGLSSGLVDALIEVQTTGRVEATELPPRPVTRIDEALVRDFADFTLAAFSRETAEAEGRDWPGRIGYGSRIRDPGQVNLLMPEGSYLVLSARLGFDGVRREARVVLVLPRDPALLAETPGSARAGPGPDAAWLRARTRMLDAMPVPVEAVLMRLVRPLGAVEALQPGDLLPFSQADLQDIALEDVAGRTLLRGRLGQQGGRRAVRLSGRPAGEAASQASPPATAAPTSPNPPSPAPATAPPAAAVAPRDAAGQRALPEQPALGAATA